MEKSNGLLQEIFGRNLKERRKRMGFSQGEMARRIGVSTSFVTEIEKGRKAPSFATIEKIAEETHAPVWSYFCEGGSEIRDDDMTSLEVLRYRLKQSVCSAIDKTMDER